MPKTKKRPDGRYSRQVYIGKDPSTGKRRYKTFYASTAREVDRLANEDRTALGRGLDTLAGPRTVKDLLDALIATKAAQGVGASWLRCLKNHQQHLSPLWRMPAERVRTADIQAVLNQLAEDALPIKPSARSPARSRLLSVWRSPKRCSITPVTGSWCPPACRQNIAGGWMRSARRGCAIRRTGSSAQPC